MNADVPLFNQRSTKQSHSIRFHFFCVEFESAMIFPVQKVNFRGNAGPSHYFCPFTKPSPSPSTVPHLVTFRVRGFDVGEDCVGWSLLCWHLPPNPFWTRSKHHFHTRSRIYWQLEHFANHRFVDPHSMIAIRTTQRPTAIAMQGDLDKIRKTCYLINNEIFETEEFGKTFNFHDVTLVFRYNGLFDLNQCNIQSCVAYYSDTLPPSCGKTKNEIMVFVTVIPRQ